MQYNPDEIVALDAQNFTLRTALKNLFDQIGPMAALWRERGLEPSFFDAEDIIQLRTRMALEEYANALRAFASADVFNVSPFHAATILTLVAFEGFHPSHAPTSCSPTLSDEFFV
jgi:hypothetical protein